jgi:hypothetical protein
MFKLNWIDKEKQGEKYQFVKDLFIEEVQKQFDASESTNAQKSPLIQHASFFYSIVNKVKPVDHENSCLIELLEYLDSDNRDILMLKKYPTVLKIFKQNNVILPSSAPVERMFSTGGRILTPSRNKLCD